MEKLGWRDRRISPDSGSLFQTFLNRLTWGTELFGPLLLTEEIVTQAPVYRDFQLEVPRTPGLGLTLDEERLAFFARK